MEYGSSVKAPGNILIVDDGPDITAVLSSVLTERGYNNQTACNGVEALKLYDADNFDIVITDLKMPEMGGLELLSAIRQRNHEATVIIMTGYATVETAVEALKNGAYDYILKPFKLGELMMVIDRAYEKIRLAQENLQLREQITLLKLSESVSSTLSLDEVLSMLLEAAGKEVQADGVELLFRPPGSREFSRRLAMGHVADIRAVFKNVSELEAFFKAKGSLKSRGDDLIGILTMEAKEVVGSVLSVPLKKGGDILGVLSAFSRSERRDFLPREEKALLVLGDRAAQSLENALLYAGLENTFRETIQGLAMAVEAKDAYTHGHSESVTRLCVGIAEELGCDNIFIGVIRQAGILHDIGKIGITSGILNKPGRLTPEEYEIIKTHPFMGKRILENISFLKEVVPMVYHHHERYDGMGYPDGLAGENIPFGARIMQVADTYDAMTSDRPYRKGLDHEVAVNELLRCSGTQFDPQCVEALIRMFAKIGAK